MRKRLILAAITVIDAWIVFKGCVKVFIVAVKNGLNPWRMVLLTRYSMWSVHKAKMIALKTGARFSPAAGEYLDRIAESYGVRRDGRSDEELRAVVFEKRERILRGM